MKYLVPLKDILIHGTQKKEINEKLSSKGEVNMNAEAVLYLCEEASFSSHRNANMFIIQVLAIKLEKLNKKNSEIA